MKVRIGTEGLQGEHALCMYAGKTLLVKPVCGWLLAAPVMHNAELVTCKLKYIVLYVS